MNYPIATGVRALACILTVLLMMAQSHNTHAQDTLHWSFGARTGAYYEYNWLRKSAIEHQNYQGTRDGMYHQLFVNYAPGKQQRLMLEASMGYNAFGYEDKESLRYNGGGGLSTQKNSVTRVASLSLEAKYKVMGWRDLRWNHYAGISFGYHQHFINDFTMTYRYPQEEVVKTSYNEQLGYYYFGLVYSGEINVTPRLSTQYTLGYLLCKEMDGIKRLNVNFGFGYNF